MLNSVIPSYNPADAKSESGKQDFLFDQLLMKIEKIAPAQIISYDRETNRAVVQILNQAISSDGGKITRQPLTDIPTLMLYGGDFVLSFPIKEGDVGWICAADRNISIFKQTLKMFAPATYEKHRYKDSFFVPNLINSFTINEEDKEAVLISLLDGNTRISIKTDTVTTTSKDIVDDATNITMTATTKTKLTSPAIEISGDTTQSGNITASGAITGTSGLADLSVDTAETAKTFTTADGKTVTVSKGIVISITGGNS